MRATGRHLFTRRRLLISVLVIVGIIAAGWTFGRYPLARWAVRSALAKSRLEPATFEIESVGLGMVRVANLSAGSAPWLTAGSVEVTFSPGNLVAARVGTIRLADARWTVHSQDGVIDWGYVPRTSDAPPSFDVPCDLIEVTGSVVRVVVNGAAHDVLVTGRLVPTGPGAAAVQADLAGLGRKATLAAQVKTEGHTLTIGVDGHTEHPSPSGDGVAAGPVPTDPAAGAPSDTPPSRWHAVLVQEKTGGATTFDMDLTLDSIAEHAGGVEIALAQARITGQAVLGEGGMTGLTCSISARGLRAGGVTLQAAELKATKAGGPELALELAATGEGWELPGARGSVAWETTGGGVSGSPRSTTFTAALRTEKAVSVNVESSGITGLVESISAEARLRRDESGVQVVDGRLTLDGGSLQAGDIAISDAHADVVMRDPKTIDVTTLTAVVGDGSLVSAAPFTWDLRTARVRTRLTMSNLSLAHWLPIITKDHATGEGRVSGSADVGIDWSSGSAELSELNGAFRADPDHGFIQALDADALGEMLEKQDPRFATDEVMRPVRDKIIAALRDFEFKQLTVDLSRRAEHTVALTYLSGFGRHGYDPQGLNLTLDLHVQDSFVGLSSRIAAKSRVNAAAGSALEEFFQETTDGQEKR